MVRSNHQGIMRQRKKFAHEDVTDIEYDNLVTDPEATVKSIYQHFGLTMNVVYQNNLIQDCILARAYKSTHQYTIEDYGFTREEITHYLASSPTEDKVQLSASEYQYLPDVYP